MMKNLRIPGPTPYYPSVYEALKRDVIPHRSSDFHLVHQSIIENLKPFFGTTKNICLVTSSGTGGMEAGIVNLFTQNDTILSLQNGSFGKRWSDMAETFGLVVKIVKEPAGKPLKIKTCVEALKATPQAKGVLITYHETSTTVVNPVEELTRELKKINQDVLILVDAVSILGSAPMEMDLWGVDFVVTASQKCWSSPPGIAMIAVSDLARNRIADQSIGNCYFDLGKALKKAENQETTNTPAISTIFGLEAALKTISIEDTNTIFNKYQRLRDMFREGIKQIGLKPVVDDAFSSPVTTALFTPKHIQTKEWLAILNKKYDTIIANGYGELKDSTVRVAHMGNVTEKDIIRTLDDLRHSLSDLGFSQSQ